MADIMALGKIPQLLISYRYLIFLPLSVFEGPVVTVVAGFLSSLGIFNIVLVYILAVIGDIIGDLLYYCIGILGRKRLKSRGKFLWISQDQVEKFSSYFKNNSKKVLLFGKWTHAPGLGVLISAGIAGIPIKEFFWINLLGTLPKVLVFLIIGYYFGYAYAKINGYFNYFFLILLGISLIILWKFRAKIFKNNNTQ